jgi:hypothetical protein
MTPRTTVLAIAAALPTIGRQPPAPPPAPADPPDPAGAQAPPAADPARPLPAVEYPHPLITEVLYAVPTGPEGDASGDGKRDAAGDEFLELTNPHQRPINLRGYRITDRNEPGKGQLAFVFPALELPPGAVVVVFNGHEQKWTGPVGDTRAAPPAPNERFHHAFVLTMKAASEKTSWANGGDWALLSDPAGNPVHCVWWGKFTEKKPERGLVEEAPLVARCSVQRTDASASGSFVAHTGLAGDVPFSPGVYPAPVAPAAPNGAPPSTDSAPSSPAPAPSPPPPPRSP